jgi:hypothetical protein
MLAKKMVIFLSQTESTPKHFLEKKTLYICMYACMYVCMHVILWMGVKSQ